MFSIKSPSEYVGGLFRRLTSAQKTAFLSCFLIGFFCHLFIFTNSMYNNDDIRNLYVNQDRTDLGRWFLTYTAGISSFFSLPVVNGILSLLFLGLTGMVLVSIYDIEKKGSIILISGLLVTFPSVACIFSYMFTADAYFISCFLCALSVYFVTRFDRKNGWIYGAICLCFSVGIYQAYLTFVLLLLLLYFLLALLQPQQYTEKQLFQLIIRFVCMLGSGMLAYYIFLNLMLRAKQTSLSSYQGISQSSSVGFSELKNRILLAYKDFLHFFSPGQILAFNKWMMAALIICILLLILCFLILYFKQKVYQSPIRNLLLILCIVVLPLCANTIYLISTDVNYHMLMRHSWCLFFIAVMILFEKTAPYCHINTQKLLEWGAFSATILIVWNYILLTNIAYFNMNFRYEKTYALCIKIMDRIEQSEDYDKHRKMAFIGNYSKTYKMEATADLLEPMVGMKGPRVFGSSSRCYLPFFQNCLGEDIEVVTPEEEAALQATSEFQEMPYFPDSGSIRVINDITVIKLND